LRLAEAEGCGATRYARPCRPVKPLLMICVLAARSAEQRAQRRWDVAPERKLGGAGGELLWIDGEGGLVEIVLVLSVLDLRRRKGREGMR
jgi:hypothetical protein